MRTLTLLAARLVAWLAYRTFAAEGLNGLLLFLPAQLIGPLLRQHGARIGEQVELHSPLYIHNASAERGRHYAHLVIGNGCYFGRGVFLDLKDAILFEDNVTVSMQVTVITHTDAGRSPVAARLGRSHAPVMVRSGAYLGAGATVLEGVEIGAEAIVGAGAVVTASVPAGATVMGVPARVNAGSRTQGASDGG